MFSAKDLFASKNPSTQYQVAKSLRFRSSASAYLNRTFSGTGNTKTWTWSAWVKRGTLGVKQNLFGTVDLSVTNRQCYISFEADNTVSFWNYTTSGYNYQLTTTQVFRDPSAWYHLVFVSDTSKSTSSDRLRIYLNGVRITAFGTASYPSLNFDGWVNANTGSGVQLGIGRVVPYAGTDYFDGYMADVNFIDGQALDASYFGEYNTTTGVWQPKAYSGSGYGTNGFYLKFTDVGATSGSNAGYGKDFSGNSNYWTTNNFNSTSTSTSYDSMYDTPTNYSNNVTGAGNYCVLNPLKIGSAVTLSDGNLKSAGTTTTWNTQTGTVYVTSGKWYAEVTVGTTDGSTTRVGVGIAQNPVAQGNYLGSDVYGYAYYDVATKYNNASSSSYGATYTTGAVIGIALDLDAGTLVFYKNGSSQGTAYSSLSGAFTFAVTQYGSGSGCTINFGQQPFAQTVPSGYSALNTQNLPTPTILNGASYMAAVLYNGTSASNTVTTSSSNSGNNPNGTTFQPDLVWIKSRSAATDHKWTDAVRGTTKAIISDTNGAETTDTNGLTAFTSSGFTVGSDSNYNNGTGPATYVAWEWKANGAGSSNSSGTITGGSTVSANTTAGFSVVTWTGDGGSSKTVGHGLGATPGLIITKARSTTNNWNTWHQSLSSTAQSYLLLNSTQAATTDATVWGNTSPNSTTFGVGWTSGSVYTNQNTVTYAAYCWAPISGFSAMGSYTGNGSADGPFIYCGFRPRWIMLKDSSAVLNWIMYDTSRDPYNVSQALIKPNLADAETTGDTRFYMDILSNGFKIKTNWAGWNTSGDTIIYAAFAENPFKISRAR